MKYFTHEEAELAIPTLEKILSAAAEVRRKLEAKLETIQRLGDGPDAARLAIETAQAEFLAHGLEDTLRAVESMGAVLKSLDPILVDFPYRLEGQEVYLCWKAGEKNIDHYHGIEEGFPGRKPLPQRSLKH